MSTGTKKIFYLTLLIFFLSEGIGYGYTQKEKEAIKIKIKELIRKSGEFVVEDNDSSYIFAVQAKDLALKIKELNYVADAWMAISQYYTNRYKYPEAVETVNKYLKIYQDLRNDSILVNGYGRIAGYCIKTNNLDIAMNYLKKAQSIAISTKRNDLIGLIDHGVALYYYSLNDYYKSISYCNEGLEKMKGFQNEDLIARFYRKLGDSYVGLKKYDQALIYYDSSLALFSRINAGPEVGVEYTRIGHVYGLKGEIRKSLEYNMKALAVRRHLNNKTYIGSSFSNIANNYINLNMPDSALYFLHLAEVSLADTRNFPILDKVYEQAYEIYKSQNNIEKALYFLELYSKNHPRVLAAENQVSIGNMAIKKYISEKEMENQLQKEELRVKNIQLIFIGVTGAFLLLILLIIAQILRRIRKEKKIQEELNASLENEINIRKKVEADLQESEQRYRFISENSPDLIMREDMEFRKSFVSPSSIRILGFSPNEIINQPGFFNFIHPDSLHDWLAGITNLKTSFKPTRIVFRARRKNNSLLWAECMINPVIKNNQIVEMVTVLRDITERVEYQEEIEEHSRNKELLMREVHHRVKNNLGILQSMVRMHRNRFNDEKIQALLDDLQFRVQTIAMVHNQLHISKNIDELAVGAYLASLAKAIMKTFDNGRIEVHTLFHEEMVHVDVLLPLGLIVNELLTNIYKHAFPGELKGHIWVKYEKLEGNLRRITVADDGIGFPRETDFENMNSLGSQLILSLTRQLNGEIVIDGSNGGSFTITLPVRTGKKSDINNQKAQ